MAWAVCVAAMTMAVPLSCAQPRRSKARWRRPIATIRSSTRSALRSARSTRTSRRRSPAIRPRVTGSIDSGYQHYEAHTLSSLGYSVTNTNISPRGGTVGLVQTMFNGFRTGNQTRQAESQVLSGRETLRNIEQTVMLDAATAYMNVMRDSRDPRPAAAQRAGAAGAAQADARPLQRRRGHQDRRRAGRVAPCRGPVAGARRRGELARLAGDLPPRRRRGAGQFAQRRCRSIAFRRARSKRRSTQAGASIRP